jgi:photosystem II stability/assembly factor-like uncharacterized protein
MKENLHFIFRFILPVAFLLFFGNSQVKAGILLQPRNVSPCEYSISPVSFSVGVDKIPLPTGYQWQAYNTKTKLWVNIINTTTGVKITGATAATLTFGFSKAYPVEMIYNGNKVRCVVSYAKGTETSKEALITVLSTPIISGNPAGDTKTVGESVTFTVTSTGSSREYQWQKDGIDILSATGSSYTIGNVLLTDAGTYRCRVYNTCKGVYSSGAVLNVNPDVYPDAWFLQTSPTTKDIKKLSVISKDIAYAVAYDTDKILKTTNRGTLWEIISAGYGTYWYAIEFLDQNTGFVGGYNRIMKTTDGGLTTPWAAYDIHTSLSLADYPYINDIQFVNTLTGWAVGSGGLIIKTTDGGVTWGLQNYQSVITDAVLYSVFFLNTSTGYAVGENGIILKTTNGGTNWAKLTVPPGVTYAFQDIDFPTTDNGFVVSPNGVLKTTDGGTSWSALTGQPTSYIYSIDFADANNGYMAGYYYPGGTKGTVLKTDNGGTSWYRQKTEGSNLIYSIEMASLTDGFIVADGGEIHRTAKGGCLTPKVNLYADQLTCTGNSPQLVADTFVNNLNCKYLWTPDNQTTGKIYVTTANTYGVTATNECGTTASDDVVVTFNPRPTVSAGPDISVCKGKNTQLFASGGETYSWNNQAYLDDPNIPNPIATPVDNTTFTVTATDENGCSNSDDVLVNVRYPYEGSEICMVTIDEETERNMVVWEKTPGVGIASYNVYREKLDFAGQYELIGNVGFNDLSIFVDTSSRPSNRQYLYKIAAVDTCENVSSMSKYHKTMLLKWSTNSTAVNLDWNKYEIQDANTDSYFPSYKLWRGTKSNSINEYKVISASVNTIIDDDPNALNGRMYYRIAAVRSSQCAPAETGKKASSGPYLHSLSNLEDNRLQGTGISNLFADALKLTVYPSPFTDLTSISYTLQKPSKMKIEIYNVIGEKIGVILDEKQTAGYHKLEMKAEDVNYVSGLYYLRIMVNDEVVIRKTMLTK